MTVIVNGETKVVTVGIQGIQGAGVTKFLNLEDTPSTFVAGKILKVNIAANALEYADNDTNLTYTASTRLLATDTGTNITLPLVTTATDGLLSASDKTKLDGIELNSKDDQTGSEIKVLYEGEADTNAFNDAFKQKLEGIEASATADQTAEEIRTLVQAANNSNVFEDADHSKLDGIEALATADQSDAEIRALVDSAIDSNVLTDALKNKVDGIEANATEDQTASEIKALYESEANTNAYTDSEKSKLLGIEGNATQDQTDAEIRAAVEAATDSNVFTDADHNKLNLIEDQATADQTASEIRTLVESANDSNVFTDADHNKLNLIEDQATQDQTGAEIKQLYETENNTNAYTDAEKLKLGAIEAQADVTDTSNVDAAGAVMNTDTDTTPMGFVVDEDNMISNSSTKVPTQQSVKAYVDSEVADVVNSAPSNLDTLKELSDALGADANFSTTVTNNIATKLAKAGGTMTGNIVMSGTQTVDGRDLSVDGAKLDGIESGATADQTDAEIKIAYENNTNTNAYTDAEKSKLLNIEALATADQTDSEIRAAVEAASDSNVFTDADHDKLNAIEANATQDQTAAEIKTLYESNANSNEYSDAEQNKLNQIEANATQDQTDTEIKTAYENNSNTNAYTDAEKSKLNQIAAQATNVTNNNQIANGANYVTASIINSLDANNLSSGTIPDARFPSVLPAISAANLTNLPPTIGGSNGVDFNDNISVRFGTSNDLTLTHDGTNSKINSTEGTLKIEHTGNGTIEFRRQGGGGIDIDGNGWLLPSSTNSINLGYSSYRWNKIWGNEGDFSGTLTTSTITPSATQTYNLGSSTKKWNQVFAETLFVGSTVNAVGGMFSSDIHASQGKFSAEVTCDDVLPNTNNSFKIGTSTNKWSEVHATTYYGDGSNLTNLPAPDLTNHSGNIKSDNYFSSKDTIYLLGGSGTAYSQLVTNSNDILIDARGNSNKIMFRTASGGNNPTGTTGWDIETDGDLVPTANKTVDIGSSSKYVDQSYLADIYCENIAITQNIMRTSNGGDIGSSSYKFNNVYATNFHGDGSNLTGISGGVSSDAQYNTVAGTDAGSSFSGTSAEKNTLFGYQAGKAITTADGCTLIGYQAGEDVTTGGGNTIIGDYSGERITTQGGNTFLGQWAASENIGSSNVALGSYTMKDSGTGSSCVAIGGSALYNNHNGNFNIGIGSNALYSLWGQPKDYNIGIGAESLRNSTGDYNIAIGRKAGIAMTSTPLSGQYNILIGNYSGNSISSGSNNTLLGEYAGATLTTGQNNLILGHEAEPSAASVSNEVTIGNASVNKFRIPAINFELDSGIVSVKNGGTQSEMRLYCESNNAHYAAIKAPAHSTFSGNLTYTLPSSYGSNTQVLTSDGSGGTSWTTPSSGGASVGGANTQVQFNSSGALAGSSNLTFDGTNVTVGGTVTATSSASSNPGLRKITASTAAPSGGSDGDVWIKYS